MAQDTRERLLDAAEALFAEYGFHGVSMRQVMQEVDVQLAAVHYHFGRKEDLFRAVIARRAGELNALRLQRLEKVLSSREKPTVEAVADAIMRPLLELSLSGDSGWRNYCRLISQMVSTSQFRDVISEYFDELAARAIEALRQLFPQCPAARIYSCYYLMVGAMTFAFAQSGRLDALARGVFLSSDLDAVYPALVSFVSHGVRGIACPQTSRLRTPLARKVKSTPAHRDRRSRTFTP